MCLPWDAAPLAGDAGTLERVSDESRGFHKPVRRPAELFDRLFSADDPATVPAREARFLKDDDEVLGLVIRGKARAYAVTMLSYHHVVNDVIAGIPVAVTY